MKDSNNLTGRGRSSCPFYEELDTILGSRAASSPPVLLDSGEDRTTTVQAAINGMIVTSIIDLLCVSISEADNDALVDPSLVCGDENESEDFFSQAEGS